MVVAGAGLIGQLLTVEQTIRLANLVKDLRKWFYLSAKTVCRYCAMVLSPGTPLALDTVGSDLLLKIVHPASGKSSMSWHHCQIV